MKVIILAGGFGSRISEESILKPKPMVTIGGKPILWHIMKSYSYYGFNEFIILCGYKSYIIKEYFSNYYKHLADMTIDLRNNDIIFHKNNAELLIIESRGGLGKSRLVEDKFRNNRYLRKV